MPRYFFDIAEGANFPDLEGSEWPDLAAAQIEAIRYSAEVLIEMPELFWNAKFWTITVSDEKRAQVFRLKFMAETAPAAARVCTAC